MIKSMTGYSRQNAEISLGALTIEVKTRNHRHCNVSVGLPPLLSQFEHPIKTAVRNHIHRGHAHVNIELSESEAESGSSSKVQPCLGKTVSSRTCRTPKRT